MEQEYKEIAALLSLGIDLLEEVSKDNMTVDELREQIKMLKEDKEKLIQNPEYRQMKYAAGYAIFNLF